MSAARWILILLIFLFLNACGENTNNSPTTNTTPQTQDIDDFVDEEPEIVDEQEPNNGSKQPQILAFQKTIRGTIGPVLKGKGDEDWFVLEVPAKQRIKAKLTGVPEIDLSLTFFSEKGEYLLAINNRKEGEGEDLPVFGLESGKTLVRVREVKRKKSKPKADELHPYLLSFETLPESIEEEFELNNKRVDANDLAIGQEVYGYLAWYKDTDWYKISTANIEEGSLMRIDFKGVQGVTPRIQVYDNIEDKILQVSPVKPDEPLTRRNIAVQSGPNFDVYYIVVSATKGHNLDERYALAVSFEKGSGDTELEPNDDRKKATLIENGQNLAGLLSQNDVDYYKVLADSPAILRVELEGVEDVNLRLEVQNPQGKTISSVNEGGKKEGETIPDVAIPMGENYIKVSGGKGEYNDTQSYVLGVLLAPQDGTMEIEPNNSRERATEIAPGLTLSGYHYPQKDIDFYRLDLSRRTGPTALEINISGIPKVDFSLSLLDETKTVVEKAEENSVGEGEFIRTILEPGIYDIQVGGKSANPRDLYQLRVEER